MAYLLDTNYCFLLIARDPKLAAATAARAAEQLRASAKIGFTDNDLWIAASAIEHDAVLVSDDGDYRRMSDVSSLEVETWLR